MNLGLVQPAVMIDINDIEDLDYVRETDSAIAIGALTRHATLEHSPLVRDRCPLLAEVLPLIGDRQVRNRGTIGGSLAHADPVAEIPTVAACLEAIVHVEGPKGGRDIPASQFFQSYLTTSLQPGEILTEVRFPSTDGAGVAFKELVRRKGDFAIVAAAAAMTLNPDGTCAGAMLALAGVAPTPIRATASADALRGQRPTEDALKAVAERACEGIEPEGDVLASAEYRRAMAPVFARRALAEAMQRAGAH
jgi:carbon-monoxide dehydrogenase medium subunit